GLRRTNRQFAARVEAMRNEKPPRLTLRSMPPITFTDGHRPDAAEVAIMNDYLRAFMPPRYGTRAVDTVVCPCCEQHLFSGRPTVDATQSGFRGGATAGDGYCERCVYPIRMIHALPNGRCFAFPLAYHPDVVRVTTPSEGERPLRDAI